MRRTGFYLAGSFTKGRKGSFMLLNQSEKPFEIDAMYGTVVGKVIPVFHKNMKGFCATDWFFFEGDKLTDIDDDESLQLQINNVWKGWCGKYKRKYSPLITLPNSKKQGD